MDAVQGVSGEPGDGLGQNQVDFPLAAQLNHLVELVPVLGPYHGDAVIGENPCQQPALVVGDFLGIVVNLDFKTVLLFFFLSADPAVGGHPQELSPGGA